MEPPFAHVLIVDPLPAVQAGVEAFLADLFQVCASASSPREALASCAVSEPDLIVTELSFANGVRLDYLEDLRARYPGVRVGVYSSLPEEVYKGRAVRVGACAWVNKHEGAGPLRAALRDVLASRDVWSVKTRTRTRRGPETDTVSVVDAFTDRELRVYELMGKGMGTSQIAEILHLSPRTIETHKAKLKRKAALSSSGELQVQAVEWLRVAGKAPVKPTGKDPHERGPYTATERSAAYCLITAAGERVPIDPLVPLVIGRGESAQVRLTSTFVSREQAVIQWDVARGFLLNDLGSRNGTLVNGHPLVTECLLRDGDSLHVAGVRLEFRAIEEPGRTKGEDHTDTWAV